MSEKYPERTPKVWAEKCLELLLGISPEYRRNRLIKGRFLEFVRPLSSGLLVSINFVRIHDVYYLGCALTFSEAKIPWLHTPLWAGNRFAGEGINSQIGRDFGLIRGDAGYPPDLFSFSKWRSNTVEQLDRGFRSIETHLLQRYECALRDGRRNLVRFYETAARIVPMLEPARPFVEQSTAFGVDPNLVERLLAFNVLDALGIARGGRFSCSATLGLPSIDLDAVPPEALVLHFANSLLLEKDRLGEIAEIAARL